MSFWNPRASTKACICRTRNGTSGSAAQDRRPKVDVVKLSARDSTVRRSSIWKLTGIPFAVGACLRVLVVAYVQVLHGNFLFLDDQGYDRIGWLLALDWHMNQFPSP